MELAVHKHQAVVNAILRREFVRTVESAGSYSVGKREAGLRQGLLKHLSRQNTLQTLSHIIVRAEAMDPKCPSRA